MENSDSIKVPSLKRKRTSSSESTSKENEPMMDEKKQREETEDVARTSDERIPLSEIPLKSVIGQSLSSFNESSDAGNNSNEEECDLNDFELDSNCSLESVFGDDEPAEETSPLLCSSYRKEECFNWVSAADVWQLYKEKEETETTHRTSLLFYRHPNISPRMRSVLLDWIIEVAAVYKLNRETYHLSVDYLDRYLSATDDIAKNDLQLLGVTCLFVASKYEEIYPPKASEFAYITDGACTDDEILAMEIKLTKALDWKYNVITACNWLSVFIQLLYSKKENVVECMKPNFDNALYFRVIQLLDFCTIHEGFLRYSYRCLAIASVYLACSKDLRVDFEYISDCVQWMSPIWNALKEQYSYGPSDYTLETLPPRNITGDANFLHNRMKRSFTIDLLEAVHTVAAVPAPTESNDIPLPLLTPPESTKKNES